MKKTTVLTGIALLAAAVGLSGKSPVEPVNRDRNNVAVKGYDVIAYFEKGQPVKGSARFAHSWNGSVWQFESERTRNLFAANPAKYAPQFGGYCAWAVSNNYTADIDPEAWKIVDGKLYLNYSKSVQKKWEADLYKRIGDGDRNWPGLHK